VAVVDGFERRARGDAVAGHPEVGDPTPELTIEVIVRHSARGHHALHGVQWLELTGREILEQEDQALQGVRGPEGQHADLLLSEPMADRQHDVIVMRGP